MACRVNRGRVERRREASARRPPRPTYDRIKMAPISGRKPKIRLKTAYSDRGAQNCGDVKIKNRDEAPDRIERTGGDHTKRRPQAGVLPSRA